MSLPDGQYEIPKGKLAIITTYLEMREQMPTKGVPLPEGVSFRRVVPDLAWYRDIFSRVGSEEWLWYERMKFSDSALEAVLGDRAVQFYTLTQGDRDEALLELDFRQQGECELAYFGLTPALIGTGAGRYLMDRAITLAWEGDITRFHVHTCTLDSPQALDFYVRSGFTAYRREVDVDEDPRVTGVLPMTAGPRIPII